MAFDTVNLLQSKVERSNRSCVCPLFQFGSKLKEKSSKWSKVVQILVLLLKNSLLLETVQTLSVKVTLKQSQTDCFGTLCNYKKMTTMWLWKGL